MSYTFGNAITIDDLLGVSNPIGVNPSITGEIVSPYGVGGVYDNPAGDSGTNYILIGAGIVLALILFSKK